MITKGYYCSMSKNVKWFKSALRHMLNKTSMTQRELAELSHIKQPQINRLLNSPEHSGSVETLENIAEAFNFNLPDFLLLGRSICEPDATAPPSPEVAKYLTKARKVLEGPKAHMVKDLLNLIEP